MAKTKETKETKDLKDKKVTDCGGISPIKKLPPKKDEQPKKKTNK